MHAIFRAKRVWPRGGASVEFPSYVDMNFGSKSVQKVPKKSLFLLKIWNKKTGKMALDVRHSAALSFRGKPTSFDARYAT